MKKAGKPSAVAEGFCVALEEIDCLTRGKMAGFS